MPKGYGELQIAKKSKVYFNKKYVDAFSKDTLFSGKTTLDPTKKYTIGYCRQSKEDKKKQESTSIGGQIGRLIEYSQQNNYDLLAIFIDHDLTASDKVGVDKVSDYVKARPAFWYFMQIAWVKDSNPVFDRILCFKSSRFARDHKKNIVKQLAKKNIIVWFTDDTNDEKAQVFTTAMDEYKSKEISEHTLRAMEDMFSKGIPVTKTPTGYVIKKRFNDQGQEIVSKRKLVLCKRNAPTIKKAFELKSKGLSNPDIILELKQYYKYDKTKQRWCKKKIANSNLRDWLNNEIYYTGEITFRGITNKITDPIISKELWDESR